ncbi:hypothetical protein OS493_006852 [Desmophyllum pertusum]|uniref:Uncharacterized protein n=1 Tax=Desmophyllum pertusum TaxID=174260 RepID=A0A9W9ZSC7_9CNID|nr:hypothetical protein OS493_006852 [Desmophyllum pertusum]
MDCCRNRKSKESSEHGVCEEQPESGTLLESATSSTEKNDQRSKEKKLEDHLLQTIKKGEFEEIENEIKPRAFKYCESNSLVMGMKVNFELRKLADSKGPDENRFNQLANSVEEFTTSFLDPLRSDQRWREEFGDGLDEILEDAIQLEQKKVRLKEIDEPICDVMREVPGSIPGFSTTVSYLIQRHT